MYMNYLYSILQVKVMCSYTGCTVSLQLEAVVFNLYKECILNTGIQNVLHVASVNFIQMFSWEGYGICLSVHHEVCI